VHQSLQHHAASTRLELVLLNLFQSLFSEGFCTKPDADPDGDKGGEGGEGNQLDDDIEGTGMGQGEGKKDVSDELQEEGQIDALQTQARPS
tara:strand:- start:417 stop:689 length:273 start_codon:yes stop_codon:yes gene_type:complete